MLVSQRLVRYLARNGLAYQQIEIPPVFDLAAAMEASGQPENFVQATVLIDVDGLVMTVHRPASPPPIDALRELTERPLQLLEPIQAASFFDDCFPGFIPPVGAAWDLEVLVDEEVFAAGQVCFSAGSDQCLLLMSGIEFRRALGEARRVRLAGGPAQEPDAGETPTLPSVADQLKKLYRLPPMPALAGRMSELATDAEIHGGELGSLIAIDPSLAAQVMRYARSGLFDGAGQGETLTQTLTLLGSERLAHVARGAVGERPFGVSLDGSLGINSLWRHSLYSAFLCRALAERLGHDQDMAYLCGLLHNFGLLLIAYLYPSEFQELTALRDINPEASMLSLEQEVFGGGAPAAGMVMGHAALAGLLYRLWQLPEPVIKAAGLHQQTGYQGTNQEYVLMVQLANALLKNRGIGDELSPDDVSALTEALGLEPEALAAVQQEIGQMASDLDALATPLEH